MAATANDHLVPTARRGRFTLAVVVQLAVLAISYVLWWVSDRLLYVGPFDRATFGWAVVVPVWLSAPIVAGFAGRALTPRRAVAVAVVLEATILAIAAGLFWQSVAFPACEFGAVRSPLDWIAPSIFLGAAIAAGPAVGGLVATNLARNGSRWWWAAGVATDAGLMLATIVLAVGSLLGVGCMRPPG